MRIQLHVQQDERAQKGREGDKIEVDTARGDYRVQITDMTYNWYRRDRTGVSTLARILPSGERCLRCSKFKRVDSSFRSELDFRVGGRL